MAQPAVSDGSLLQVSVFTYVEAEESVATLVESLFGLSPALYTDEDTLVTTVSVYCEQESDWTTERKRALIQGLARLRAQGLVIGRTKIRARRLRRQDWAAAWKRHFKPLEIGDALLVKPGWSRRRPRPGQALVLLDPGLSFGTGQHPTTAFCLSQIAACRNSAKPLALLDIGTGSGILAIAAAKLGYAPVTALDFDPVAVNIARENAVRNGLAGRLELEQADLTRLPARSAVSYDVICANLLADLLTSQSARILNRLRPGGRLILAGLLRKEFPSVQAVYERAGLKRMVESADREWQSAMFVRPD